MQVTQPRLQGQDVAGGQLGVPRRPLWLESSSFHYSELGPDDLSVVSHKFTTLQNVASRLSFQKKLFPVPERN